MPRNDESSFPICRPRFGYNLTALNKEYFIFTSFVIFIFYFHCFVVVVVFFSYRNTGHWKHAQRQGISTSASVPLLKSNIHADGSTKKWFIQLKKNKPYVPNKLQQVENDFS